MRCWRCGTGATTTSRSPTRCAALAQRVEVLPDRVLLYVDDADAVSAAVLALPGERPMSLLPRRSTLEDVFLRLTGRTLVD